MAEKVDVLEASHEALRTELSETERQIQFCYQRAEKLRTALDALQDILGTDGGAVALDDGSLSRVMDKLQKGGKGEKGEEEADGGEDEEEHTPVWLEKKEA